MLIAKKTPGIVSNGAGVWHWSEPNSFVDVPENVGRHLLRVGDFYEPDEASSPSRGSSPPRGNIPSTLSHALELTRPGVKITE